MSEDKFVRVGEKLKMRVRGDNVCFRVQDPKERHFAESLVLLSEGAKEQLYEDRGIVLAVGPGRHRDADGNLIPVDIEVGDIVLFLPHGGLPWREDDVEGFIVPENNIKAVVKRALLEH